MPFIPDSGTSSFIPDKPAEQGFLGKVWGATKSSAAKRFASVADTFKAGMEGRINPLETGLQTVGAAAGFVNDVAGSALIEGVQGVTGGMAGDVALDLLQTPAGKAGLAAVSKGTEAYRGWKEKNPRLAKDLESVVNIGFLLGAAKGVKASGQSVQGAAAAASKGTAKAAKAITPYVDDAARSAKTGLAAAKETAGQLGEKVGNVIQKGKQALQAQAATSNLDDVTKAVVRSGVDEKTIARVATTVPANKPLMKRMVETGLNGIDDIRFKGRPIEVAGEQLTKTASFLSKSMKETGKALGTVKKALRGKKVDIPKVRQALLDDLDDLGVALKGGKLVAKSPVSDDVMEVLGDLQKYVGGVGKTVAKVDAGDIDRLRAYLFKSFSKTGAPLQSQAQGLVTKYRNLLLESLDDIDPKYGRLAKEYATKHGSLEEFTKLLGYKGPMEDITEKGLRAGEVSLRVLGNAADRPKSVIDDLIATAKAAGYKGTENIYDLIDFADELDDVIGPASRSLGGTIERAGETVLGKVPVVGKFLETAAQTGNATAKQKLQALLKMLAK